ncbi:MAG: MotA/TolQ/ExbB proton channel family protein [Chthoniobacterales bacterium]|nr:MotA/TolQ/ExbB proton channel family protein [Chthoniobacterales bacterium]
MQALSDWFIYLIILSAIVHLLFFLGLIAMRRKRVRKMQHHLGDLIGPHARHLADPNDTIDECIASFIAEIRDVVEQPQFSGQARDLSVRLTQKDESKEYLKWEWFERIYTVVRTWIEIYPLLGILGTVLAIGAGLAAQPASVNQMSRSGPSTSGQVVVQSPPSTGSTIVRNFSHSIWATFFGLLFAIVFMLINAWWEPLFNRLIEHHGNIRTVIAAARVRLGMEGKAGA